MNNDYMALLQGFVSGALPLILPWAIPFLYRQIQHQKLAALNRYLTCDTQPIRIGRNRFIEIPPQAFYFTKMSAMFLTMCAVVAAICETLIDKDFYIVPMIVAAAALWGLFGLLCAICSREVKGLVGIIATEIKDVADSPAPKNNSIYFATHDIPGGGVYSYEERQPITDPIQIARIREDKIASYYERLRGEIDRRAQKKELFIVDVPTHGRMHVCDFMTRLAYSTENIVKHINDVCDNMVRDNSTNFIGDKVGVEGFNIENGILTLEIYNTDHFTFKVFKEIFKEKPYKEVFQLLMRRLNHASMNDKSLLCSCLKFLFSSFGLDIIVYGRKADNRKGVLLAERAGKIEEGGQSKIHVPVNESFSMTDMDDNDHFSIKACALRGIEEELGIPRSLTEHKAGITFKDFAVVTDEGEIGLGCDADISNVMCLEAATMYPGQDKFLEIKELFVLDFPRFLWDPRKYPGYFYREKGNSVLTTPWESFTPLLYQRLAIRGANLPDGMVDFFSLAVSVALLFIYRYPFDFHDSEYISEFAGCMLSLLVILTKTSYDLIKTRPHRFQPLVPQWNGDAKCMQSINISLGDYSSKNARERDPVAWYMMFGIDGTCEMPSDGKISLADIRLTDSPWCAVRHELVKNHAESPINFYPVRYDREALDDNSLHIVEIPLHVNGNRMRLSIHSIVRNGRQRFSFVNKVGNPIIDFNATFSESEILSYSRLFGVHENFLRRLKIGRFPKEFSDEYLLLDLFSFRDKYYWSVFKRAPETEDHIIYIDKRSDIYRDILASDKPKDGDFKFTIEGDCDIMLKKLSKFISHPQNRARMESVDIYMLQLALLRLGNSIRQYILTASK